MKWANALLTFPQHHGPEEEISLTSGGLRIRSPDQSDGDLPSGGQRVFFPPRDVNL